MGLSLALEQARLDIGRNMLCVLTVEIEVSLRKPSFGAGRALFVDQKEGSLVRRRI